MPLGLHKAAILKLFGNVTLLWLSVLGMISSLRDSYLGLTSYAAWSRSARFHNCWQGL